MKMFLDDIRDIHMVYPHHKEDEWVTVRSYHDVMDYIADNGIPEFISFDHDLGWDEEEDKPAKDGYDVAKTIFHMVAYSDEITLPKNFNFEVHSANPVGAKNIIGLMDSLIHAIETGKI